MSVPLDNLYHWISNMLPGPALVYVFSPHGSKKISNLDWLYDYDLSAYWQYPGIIAHDQEPLDWNFYNDPQIYLESKKWKNPWKDWKDSPIYEIKLKYSASFNLLSRLLAYSAHYDNAIIIHSEKNSNDLIQYQKHGFIDVYYWAHAIIARDWYRFAEHDLRLNIRCTPKKKFLIYCRDWSHRREYRLKFLEMLVANGLDTQSQTSIMHTNSDNVHYTQHKFANAAFNLTQPELIDKIPNNQYSSTQSSEYVYSDYISTEISVILETVFDDSRVHLTEKTLRAIACGHPFILAAGPGSLQYLRDYGFKTFAPWIDESYDLEQNSFERLGKILNAMKQIQNLQGRQAENFYQNTKKIADFNKKHFFSQKFWDSIDCELKNNLHAAYNQVTKSRCKHYFEFLKLVKKYKLTDKIKLRREYTKFARQLRQSYQHDQSSSREDSLV